MKKIAVLTMLAALTFTSCAPKYNAAAQKPVSEMSCTEMKDEYAKLLSVREQAEGKKGVSKENVAWAILFWPGAVVNEMDNRDVIDKVDARVTVLNNAAPAKGCRLR